MGTGAARKPSASSAARKCHAAGFFGCPEVLLAGFSAAYRFCRLEIRRHPVMPIAPGMMDSRVIYR